MNFPNVVGWSDAITVLRALGKLLAKQILQDGRIIDYDSPRHFDAESVTVSGLQDVARLLSDLVHRSDQMVVRGELIGAAPASGIRRLAYADKDTGDGPTLRDVPRRWLALDADGISRPDLTSAADLLGCADAVLEHLPVPFRRAACIVQATAGHGIKPGCRLRLWFWCDRPMHGAELKRWLAGTPFDASVFNTVQPIYTAAPLRRDGAPDHLPFRLAEYPGEDWLQCPTEEALAPPPRRPPETVRPVHAAGSARAQLYVEAALKSARTRIAGASLRHPAILSEACGLARFVHAGLLTRADLHCVLWAGAQAAGKADESEIARMVAFGLDNPDDAKLPADVTHG